MTCHHVKDGICYGNVLVEVMAVAATDPPSYGWANHTVSFVEDARQSWRVLWRGTSFNGEQRGRHSLNTYRTRREAVDAWNGALVVEALS